MKNSMLPNMFEDGLKSQAWLKVCVPLVLSSLSVCLLSSAILSVGIFLDKPIPTGSITQVIAYASPAIFIAALIMGGIFAIYLNVRFIRHMRSEHRAKVMANEIIKRLSAKENTISAEQRKHIKIAH